MDTYFLGPISLAGRHGAVSTMDIIDGQNRIVTLCLLLAAARARLSNDQCRLVPGRDLPQNKNFQLSDEMEIFMQLLTGSSVNREEVERWCASQPLLWSNLKVSGSEEQP